MFPLSLPSQFRRVPINLRQSWSLDELARKSLQHRLDSSRQLMDLFCPALDKSFGHITNVVKKHPHTEQKACCSLTLAINCCRSWLVYIKGSCTRPHDDRINLQGDQWAHSIQAIRYTLCSIPLALLVLCQAKQWPLAVWSLPQQGYRFASWKSIVWVLTLGVFCDTNKCSERGDQIPKKICWRSSFTQLVA